MKALRILVLGLGNFGHSWASHVTPQCEGDACLCAVVEKRRERWKGIPDDVAKFESLEEALVQVSPELVINATAPDAHLALNEALLRRGIPVLCEKPIADSLESALRLGRILEETGGFLMIGENYRYHPVMQEARRLIASGELGGIHHVSCRFRHFHPDYSMFYHGALAHPLVEDVTVHHLDLGRFLSGQEPVRVWCRESPAPYAWYGDRPANASILTEMSGGALFHYEGTLASPESTTTWNGSWEIECDRGVVIIEDDRLYLLQGGAHQEIPLPPQAEDSRIPMLQEACAALREKRRAATDFTDNFKTFRWMHAALRSDKEQQWIRIADMMKGES